MSERQIFSKILRLDKYIYNELIVLDGALQRGIAIFLAVTTLTTLSAFRLFNSLIEFLESNLVLFSGEMSDEEFAMFKALIDELSIIFIQQDSTTTLLFSSIATTTVTSLIGLVICFLILKFLFRKEPRPIDLIIISFFSSAPGLLVFPVLFISDTFIQAILVLVTSLYALVAFGSGLKQVYLLRNIEVILVIIALTFGGSILGGF
ncbi:MAG: hypothetical protein ACJ0FT_00755 [Candidatus Actinomarina sp.]|uniref:MedDCM-OCT-S29-C46-cds17 n=1 Tax=Candidatus Actinomarina minuta TaxID=1389454 RepID=S5DVI4_9ACTN|nr:MedDCM-OCT-S29-C46-cds17 [Candidatus Actinomarina minuta]|tara:strand:+ start:1451 stop:2068 length:618 start_codon:yes stop_codon:yes gene_type:complete